MKRSEFVLTVVVTTIASSAVALIATHIAKSARRIDRLETRSLTIIDSKNHPILLLSSTKDSPEIALLDQQQRKRAVLFLESNGTPDLYLYDAAGKPRAALDLYDSGVPNLELLDASGGTKAPSILLEATEEGQVRLAFHDFSKKRVVGRMEFVMMDGAPKLKLIDDSGETLWSTPAKH